jgi:hypothetical protein
MCGSYWIFAVVLLLTSGTSQLTQAWTEDADAQGLVREVVANEIHARQEDHTQWMYTVHNDAPEKKEMRKIIQTSNRLLYRTLSRNNQPLTQDQQRQEDQRIQKLLHNPSQQQNEFHKYQHDVRRALDMLGMVPEAFLFSPAGKEGSYVRLSFQPNPKFRPTTRAARISQAINGTMLVHPVEKRLVQLKGVITRNVHFGAGILGTIKKGGAFEIKQAEVAPGYWALTLIDVHIRGKALIFRSISEQQRQMISNFQRLPDNLTLPQAAAMLQEDGRSASLNLSKRHH